MSTLPDEDNQERPYRNNASFSEDRRAHQVNEWDAGHYCYKGRSLGEEDMVDVWDSDYFILISSDHNDHIYELKGGEHI